jgi:hypothetical protein
LRAGGASFESLAAKFSVDRDAIWRHWHQHVSDDMKRQYLVGPAQLAELAEVAASEGASVLDHLKAVRTILMAQLARGVRGWRRARERLRGRLPH